MSYRSNNERKLVRARVEADHILKDLRSEDRTRSRRAATRLRQLPDFASWSAEEVLAKAETVTTQQANHLVAIENGFASWQELRRAYEQSQGDSHAAQDEDLTPSLLLALAADGIRRTSYEDLLTRTSGEAIEIIELGLPQAEEGDIVHFIADGLRAMNDPRILSATAESDSHSAEAIIVTSDRVEYIIRGRHIERMPSAAPPVFRISSKAIEMRDLEEFECVFCGDEPEDDGVPDVCASCGHDRWTGQVPENAKDEHLCRNCSRHTYIVGEGCRSCGWFDDDEQARITSLFRSPEPGAPSCARCGGKLSDQGRCADVTCPFSDHDPTCEAGWSGHPEMDPEFDEDDVPLRCTCRLDIEAKSTAAGS